MSRKSCRGLLTGIVIGTGFGLLFAPKKGSETRKELVEKLNELCAKLKEVEFDDVKSTIQNKINELKTELADLDKEKLGVIARKQAENIKNKAEELYNLAVEKGTPVLQKAADEVREKTIELLNNTAKKLEKKKKAKTKTSKNVKAA